jgi:hypothetical protein
LVFCLRAPSGARYRNMGTAAASNILAVLNETTEEIKW